MDPNESRRSLRATVASEDSAGIRNPPESVPYVRPSCAPTSLDTFYAKGDPKVLGWTYQGTAQVAAPQPDAT